MTALTENSQVDHLIDQEIREFPVGAAVHIFRAALVGIDPAGLLKAFEVGDELVGIAYEEADNSSGVASAVFCRVQVQGTFEMTLASAALTDRGAALYALDSSATLALIGHPDAYFGRVVHKDNDASGKVIAKLKEPGEKPTEFDLGSVEVITNFRNLFTEPGAAGGDAEVLLENDLIGSAALGLGLITVDDTDGGALIQFDATAEKAHGSFCTPALFDVAKGITFECTLHVSDNGDDSDADIDFGIGTRLVTGTRENMDGQAQLACFHMDSNDTAINAQSDDASTDVAPVDTGAVNVETADNFKKFKVICRPSGAVEFWIDHVRVLSSTTFAMLSTATSLCCFINAEKASTDTTFVANVQRFRAAGAHVVAAGV